LYNHLARIFDLGCDLCHHLVRIFDRGYDLTSTLEYINLIFLFSEVLRLLFLLVTSVCLGFFVGDKHTVRKWLRQTN